MTAFLCLLLLLGLEERIEEKATVATGSVIHFADDPCSEGDPLRLVNRVAALELIGVSGDGSVIGYASDLSSELCLTQLTIVLEADGWTLFDNNGMGMLSFYRATKSEAESSTLFVQCIPIGQGSSIVINRW